MNIERRSSRLTKFSASCALIIIASSGYAGAENADIAVFEETDTNSLQAALAHQQKYAAPGYKWGNRHTPTMSDRSDWASQEEGQTGYKWAVVGAERTDLQATSENSQTGLPSSQTARDAFQARNVAIQAGYRWGIRNVADQAGYRWGIRNVADQAGYRWGIRNVADQAGYRWGIRNVADQAGYRWGIR